MYKDTINNTYRKCILVPYKAAIIFALFSLLWAVIFEKFILNNTKDYNELISYHEMTHLAYIFLMAYLIYLLLKYSLTEVNKYKKILSDHEERYRLAISTTNDNFWDLDIKTNKIIYSSSLKSALGYDDNDKIDNFDDLLSLVHSDDIITLTKSINEHFNKCNQSYQVEYRLKAKDGSYKWILSKGQAIYDDDGNPIRIVGSHADISVSKEKEKMLLRKVEKNRKLLNRVIKQEKLRTQFFANISHELRTPLNAIFSTLQLVDYYHKERKLDTNTNNINRYVSIMKQNCYRLLRLINNIIDITRIDYGYLKLNLKNCDVVTVVENIVSSISVYIKNKDIKLFFNSNVKEKIIAIDIDKIERVVLNLLSNAVKFTKPGGSIWVNIIDNKDTVLLSVKDTGVGIPKGMLNIVFKRFRQVDGSFTRDYEGSGIGLSIVKSLIEIHGGNIKLNSKQGSGSEFIIELPVKVLSKKALEKTESIFEQGYIDRVNIEFSDIYSSNVS